VGSTLEGGVRCYVLSLMRSTVMIRTLCALMAVACGLTLATAARAARAAPVGWMAPRLVDHRAPLSTPSILRSVACPTATRCLSVGANGTVVTTTTGASHRFVSGVNGGAGLEGISCPSASLCVIQETGRLLTSTDPTAAKPTWKAVSAPQLPIDQFAGIACASDRLCIAWSDSTTLDVSTNPTGGASAWKQVKLKGALNAIEVSAVACVPQTTRCVAAVGNGFATSTNAGGGASAWTVTNQSGFAAPEDLTCPSVTLCVGITLDDVEASTNPSQGAASWSSGALPTTSPSYNVAIACPSAAACVIARGDGSIASSTDPAAGAAGYTLSASLDPAGFGTFADTHMTCPTTGTCLVPDASPGLATITLGAAPSASVDTDVGGTTAITGLDCPSARLCLGVDDGGGILHTTKPTGSESAWQRNVQSAATDGLNSVSCPSTHFCATVGNDDRVAVSTHPATDTSWTTFKLPFINYGDDGPTPYNLDSITCASARLCLATSDEYGLIVSASPAAGPTSWHLIDPATANANLWDTASCPTATFCVAGDLDGRIAVSRHPANTNTWQLTKIAPATGPGHPPNISSISCPSTSFCLAGDGSGSVHWSTRPTGGARAWHAVKISPRRLIAISCRSRTFCVAINARRVAYASTDPTGKKAAWHQVTLATGHFPIASAALENLRSLSCAPHHVCVAGSADGVAVAGRTAK
jgi:hypothetical protein